MRYYANPDEHPRLSSISTPHELDERSESEDSGDESDASSASSEASFMEEVARLRLEEEESVSRDTSVRRFRDATRFGRSTSRARSGPSPDGRISSSGRSRSTSRPPPRAAQPALRGDDQDYGEKHFREYHNYLGFDMELLASILIPRENQCFQRFELAVDDLIFLGHPVHHQHEHEIRSKAQETTFNVVMVFDRANMFPEITSVDTGTWLSLYYTILFKITAVFSAEEARSGLITEQSHTLSQLREECMQNDVVFSEFVQKCLESASAACLLKDVYRLLARVRRNSLLSYGPLSLYIKLPPLLKHPHRAEKAKDMQHTIDMHDPIVLRGDKPEPGDLSYMQRSFNLSQLTPDGLLHTWASSTGPLLRPWQTLLLPEEAFSSTQGETAYDSVRMLVPHFKPTLSGSRTFGQIADMLGWDLYKDLYPLVRYLIYYGEARVVDVPRIQSIYIVDPTFDMEMLSDLSDRWADTFPAMPPLPWFMDALSSELRPFTSHCRRLPPDHRPLDLLVWLIRHSVIVQTHVHLRLVITVQDQLKAMELQRQRRETRKSRDNGESESDSENLIDTLRGQIQQGLQEPERPVPDSKARRSHRRTSSATSSTSSNEEWMHSRLPHEHGMDHRPARLHLNLEEDLTAESDEEYQTDELPNRALCPVLIPEPARANRTESEWIAAMLSDKHPWYTRWLIRLFPYLNGKHTVEEIVMRENLRRRDLKLILLEFEANLLHLYHP